jgi:hypothetical protein
VENSIFSSAPNRSFLEANGSGKSTFTVERLPAGKQLENDLT